MSCSEVSGDYYQTVLGTHEERKQRKESRGSHQQVNQWRIHINGKAEVLVNMQRAPVNWYHTKSGKESHPLKQILRKKLRHRQRKDPSTEWKWTFESYSDSRLVSRILREVGECHSKIISTDNQIDETFVSGKHANIFQIHFKRSALLIITEIQIKTTWRHQFSWDDMFSKC